MKKIGVSIPWDYLTENIVTEDAAALSTIYGKSGHFLKFLKDLEVSHIELRHRKEDITPFEMTAVFSRLIDYDFSITIHGDKLQLHKDVSLKDTFPWLEMYGKLKNENNPLMVTLHPITGSDERSLLDYNRETVTLLKILGEKISNEKQPLRLALENQRSKEYSISGTYFQEIEMMWREINRESVGICWDMGHGVANYIIDSKKYPLFPQPDFISSVTHTHIHDIGPSGRTHWVFKENKVPLSNFIQKLKAVDYKGIYNLELSFSRFKDAENQQYEMERSIIKLRDMI